MAADLLSRVVCHRSADDSLKVSLRRITELGGIMIDMSKKKRNEIIRPVIEASYESDCRREIMGHLRECLSEPTGRRWHRIYGGLTLVEMLVEQGAHVLFVETAHGHHFDLLQKVSFLEHFDAAARGCSDSRVQPTIRRKATELRLMLVPLLKKASAEELPPDAGLHIKDNASTCSPGCMSISTGSTTASTARSIASSIGSPSPGTSPAQPVSTTLPESERLRAELQCITHTGITEPPAELLVSVAKASHGADNLQVILEHMRVCLNKPNGKDWRRVICALAILQEVMQHGSPAILREAAWGPDFNLTQQLWALEQFQYRTSWRKQALVRKRALEVHELLVQRLQGTDVVDPEQMRYFGDAFSELKGWAEQADSSGPSNRSSSRATSESSSEEAEHVGPLVFHGPCGALAATPGALGASSTADEWEAAKWEDDDTAERFFTPMQAPAEVAMVMHTPQLLSL